MLILRRLVQIILLVSFVMPAQAADVPVSSPPLFFILDGSGSMWGRIGNVEKIVVAKGALTEVLNSLGDEQRMGLMVYGHRRKGDCDDIEVLAPIASGQKKLLISSVQSINPRGKTPIVRALNKAAERIRSLDEDVAVILVSDGKETCDKSPCDFVKSLRKQGVRLKLFVVGLDVTDEEREELQCLATAGGGSYLSAASAEELRRSLTAMTAMAVEDEEEKPGRLLVTASGASQYKIFDAAGKKQLNTVRTNKVIELEAGFYQIRLGGSRQLVRIRAGEETQLGAGTILVTGLAKNLYSVFDVTGSRKADFTHTNRSIDLLEGSYLVELNRTRRVVVIESGQTTTVKAASLLVKGDSEGLYAVYDPTGEIKYEFKFVGRPIEVLPGFYSLKIGDRWIRDIELSEGEMREFSED